MSAVNTTIGTATSTVIGTVIADSGPEWDGGSLLLEDGTSFLLLEDDSSKLILG